MVASPPSDRPALRLRLGELTFPLDEEKTVIGRSRSCDIRLREDSVSRLHAAFVWRDARLVLEDLGSSNGTFLNGARVLEPRDVAAGDVVRFGALRADLELREDATGSGAGPAPRAARRDLSSEVEATRPAGFGWRLLAAALDAVMFALGTAIPFAPLLVTLLAERYLLAADALPPSPQLKSMLAGACLTLWLVYAFFYFVHGWAQRGGSPAHRLLGLRLVDWRRRIPIGYSRALLRLAAGVVTLLTLGLGFLLVPFRRDRKALHDLLAGTMVVHRAGRLGPPRPTA